MTRHFDKELLLYAPRRKSKEILLNLLPFTWMQFSYHFVSIVFGNRTYDNSTKEILKLQNTNQNTLWRKSAQLKMSQKSLFRLHKNKSCSFLLFPFVCVRISLCVVNVKYEAVRIVWDNFSLSEKTNNEKKKTWLVFLTEWTGFSYLQAAKAADNNFRLNEDEEKEIELVINTTWSRILIESHGFTHTRAKQTAFIPYWYWLIVHDKWN